MDRLSTKRRSLWRFHRHGEGAFFSYSPGGAIGRAAMCWFKGFGSQDSRVVSSHRCDLSQLIVEGFIS